MPASVQAAKDRAALAEVRAAQTQADADEFADRRELASLRVEFELIKFGEKARQAAFRRGLAALRAANERGYRRALALLRSKAGFNPTSRRRSRPLD